jgi:DNA-directed RNA polymerase subunit RPC12/RpoP
MPKYSVPACPNCGRDLPIGEAWAAAKQNSKFFLSFKQIGVRCPHCGSRFRVLKRGATLVAVLILVVGAAVAGVAFEETRRIFLDPEGAARPFYVMTVVMLLFWWIQIRIAPYFAHVMPVAPGERLYFPLDE